MPHLSTVLFDFVNLSLIPAWMIYKYAAYKNPVYSNAMLILNVFKETQGAVKKSCLTVLPLFNNFLLNIFYGNYYCKCISSMQPLGGVYICLALLP